MGSAHLARGALLAACLAGSSAWAAERRYAVVVGANEGDLSEERLQFAEADAVRVAEVLETLAGVHAEDLVLLRAPTADRLRGALAHVSDRIRREVEDADHALVFVYYSGHADALDLHLGGTRLPLEQVAAAVREMPADVRVLVLDACRTGEILRKKGASPAEPFAIDVDDRLKSEGVAIITSAAAGEDAQESDHLRGGVFTHHLVTGLKGAADSSGDHRVTLTEAYRYSYARTLMTTSRAPELQHPSYAFDLRGQDDLVLTRLDSDHELGRLILDDAGQYVIFDAKGASVVAEVEVPAGGMLLLRPGSYMVRRRLPDRVFQAWVEVPTNGQATLATAGMQAVSYGRTARRGYASERKTAMGVGAGAGIAGPLLEDQDAALMGTVVLRLDLPTLTLMGRGRAAHSTTEGDWLTQRQTLAGGEAGLYKLFDVGLTAAGIGLRAGAAGAWQSFETAGEAPDRSALIGHFGPSIRIEGALGARLLVGLEAGADITVLTSESQTSNSHPSDSSTLSTAVVPHVTLDLSAFVR